MIDVVAAAAAAAAVVVVVVVSSIFAFGRTGCSRIANP